MATAPKRGRAWIYNQVFSALIAAEFTSGVFHKALWQIGQAWLTTEAGRPVETVSLPRWLAWGQLAAFMAAVIVWFAPVGRYLRDDGSVPRETALKRFNGTYAFIAVLWLSSFVVSTTGVCWAWHARHPDETALRYLTDFVAPQALGAYYAIYLSVLYLEPLLLMKAAHRFHEGEELYRRKEGLALGLRAKLFLMILNLLVIPMILLALMIARPYPGGFKEISLMMIAFTLAYALGYTEMLYRSITEPVAGLVRKMARVGGGDYGVRTSVLSGDEIGVMKAHFNDMVEGLAERERLKDTFGRYVSVEVARQLMRSGKIVLGGESIEATILFSDIRDFTPLSEKLPPQELVAFLNSYFSYVTAPITKHNGVVSKFIGDAVMAIFAPQFGSRDHAGDAVRAALAMRDQLAEFNARRASPAPVRFGVGLHSGILVAGNIGTEQRLEYTVIGDTVNIASRIESHNKELDSTILISEEVHRRLDAGVRSGLRAERCENVRVKGKERPLVLYKLL